MALALGPEARGPQKPLGATPPRRPRSIRRTTTISCFRPGVTGGDVHVEARGRDLVTSSSGNTTVADHVVVTATVSGTGGTVTEVSCDRDVDLTPLLGQRVGPGFRGTVRDTVPDEVARGSVLHLLLDDWVGANLIAGYALLRAAGMQGSGSAEGIEHHMADLCAGWVRGGVMLNAIEEHGQIPVPVGPLIPAVEEDDPQAWHHAPPLPAGAIRRSRRIDVWSDDGEYGLDVAFRDAHGDTAELRSSIHEYAVTGSLDRSLVVRELAADPRVLPWTECPGAAASAGRLAGLPVADARQEVRRSFTGTSTCTHLNDVLRSLGDVGALVDTLRASTT